MPETGELLSNFQFYTVSTKLYKLSINKRLKEYTDVEQQILGGRDNSIVWDQKNGSFVCEESAICNLFLQSFLYLYFGVFGS